MMGIGRRWDTRRTERERGGSGEYIRDMYKTVFPMLLEELHHENIKNRFQLVKRPAYFQVDDLRLAQVALMFKVMFEIYRAIEIWRQIVGIVRRIV